jgi:hypothetical protein
MRSSSREKKKNRNGPSRKTVGLMLLLTIANAAAVSARRDPGCWTRRALGCTSDALSPRTRGVNRSEEDQAIGHRPKEDSCNPYRSLTALAVGDHPPHSRASMSAAPEQGIALPAGPADVEEIIAAMNAAGGSPDGLRLRAAVLVLERSVAFWHARRWPESALSPKRSRRAARPDDEAIARATRDRASARRGGISCAYG